MVAVRTSFRALRMWGLAFGRTITLGSTTRIKPRATTTPPPAKSSEGVTDAGTSLATSAFGPMDLTRPGRVHRRLHPLREVQAIRIRAAIAQAVAAPSSG